MGANTVTASAIVTNMENAVEVIITLVLPHPGLASRIPMARLLC